MGVFCEMCIHRFSVLCFWRLSAYHCPVAFPWLPFCAGISRLPVILKRIMRNTCRIETCVEGLLVLFRYFLQDILVPKSNRIDHIPPRILEQRHHEG
jgi:hypothetical protein